MKSISLSFILFAVAFAMQGQTLVRPSITDMRWSIDYNIYIKLSNDSNYVYDVKALPHSGLMSKEDSSNYIYYPVNLDLDFVNALKDKKLEESEIPNPDSIINKNRTLWNALHYTLSGGRIHFINCLLYSIETGQLSITAPLLQRPSTKWKPNPMTDTYRRTRKWKFYIPATQKEAHKEFRIRQKENKLSELVGIPNEYIDLFLKTSDKQYQKLKMNRKTAKTVAKIDLIKVLLGAPYLGVEQIEFIRNRVLKSVRQYSTNNLPSVIVFDDLNAAVAMTLSEQGYEISKIVFNDAANLSFAEAEFRREKIRSVITRINDANNQVFKENLKRYYR